MDTLHVCSKGPPRGGQPKYYPVCWELTTTIVNLTFLSAISMKLACSGLSSYIQGWVIYIIDLNQHIYPDVFSISKPVLQYGTIVYGNTNKTQMDRLCLMQRNAIRAMFNMSKHSSVDQVRVRLKILTVSELYIYDLMKSQCSNAYAMSLIVNA